MNKIEETSNKFTVLNGEAEKIKGTMGSLANEIDELAKSVRKSSDQSQEVIERVGQFIERVFEIRSGRGPS
jgi:uncharacterized coiled-coil DUF342 family protein